MNRSLIRSASLLAFALTALAACGGGDSASEQSGQGGGDAPAAAPAGEAPAAQPQQTGAVPIDSTKKPTITSFAGLDWGASKADIVAKLGQPKETRVQHEGVETLGWDDTVAGRPASKVLTVHPQRGLIQGVLQVQPGGEASCMYLYQTLTDSMKAQYTGLAPEAKTMGNPSGQMCAATPQESSGAAARWADPGNGVQLFVAVPPGARTVNVVGTTPEGEAWAARGTGART